MRQNHAAAASGCTLAAALAESSIFCPRLCHRHNALDELLFCRLYLRCERQTLSRLERTNAVLFTIRTYTRPLSELADRPAVCKRLAGALRNTDDAFVRPLCFRAVLVWQMHWQEQPHHAPASSQTAEGAAVAQANYKTMTSFKAVALDWLDQHSS